MTSIIHVKYIRVNVLQHWIERHGLHFRIQKRVRPELSIDSSVYVPQGVPRIQSYYDSP